MVTGTESGLFVVLLVFLFSFLEGFGVGWGVVFFDGFYLVVFSVFFIFYYCLAGDLQYHGRKFCSPFQDLPNPKHQNCSVWLMLNSFLLPLIVHPLLYKLFEGQSLTT